MTSQAQALLMWRPAPYVFVNKVQSAIGGTSCPAFSLTLGNAVIVTVNWYNGGSGLGSCTAVNDTAGNVYFANPTASQPNRSACKIFTCLRAVGNAANVVTATFTGGAAGTTINVMQVTGGYRIQTLDIAKNYVENLIDPISTDPFQVRLSPDGLIVVVTSNTSNFAFDCTWNTNVNILQGTNTIQRLTVGPTYSGYAGYIIYTKYGDYVGAIASRFIEMTSQLDYHALSAVILI